MVLFKNNEMKRTEECWEMDFEDFKKEQEKSIKALRKHCEYLKEDISKKKVLKLA